MNLSESLDQHERESGASAGARRVAALRRLRDYRVEYAEITEIAALTPSDLEDLFRRWYLTHEQADPEGALELIDAAEGWRGWLDRREAVAPPAQGWEVLEVSGVFPGGHDAAAP
jgi:hypothetical protein